MSGGSFHRDVCDIDCERDEAVKTPLMVASESGQLAIAQQLLDRGVDVNRKCLYLGTALSRAALHGHCSMIELLVSRGASLDAEHFGRTPLSLAIVRGHVDAATLLLELGCELNPSKPTFPPLCDAATSGRVNMVELLLSHGANIEAENKFGYTPLMNGCLSVSSAAHDVVKVLIDHGADIDKSSEMSGTALCAAARIGKEKLVCLLLDSGADVNKVYRYGTALSVAMEGGYTAIVDLLVSHGARDVRMNSSDDPDQYKFDGKLG